MRVVALILVSILLISCGTGGGGGNSAGGTTQTSGSLTVRLIEPQDGTTVSASPVKVRGEAPPETVVTVNDDILVVGSDRKFESQVDLSQGPNVIEVDASDTEGNEVTFMVTVTYSP